MSQGIPAGYVLPTPQRAKLVGTLNIVFASLLLVYILFKIAFNLLTPMLMQMSGGMIKQVQTKVDQQRQDQVAELKKEAAEAKTAEEKTQAEERLRTLENSPKVTMPDMNKITNLLGTPAYQAYTWTDMISGLALNLVMLISGIGLLQLKEWGRKMALSTFGLKIIRLFALALMAIIIIIPITYKVSSDMLAGMTQGGAGGPPAAMMGDVAKFQAAFGSIQVVLGAVFGSVWPIIGMVLLTRSGTRAACRASVAKPTPKPLAPDEGLS
jgi:hypothetical protein